MAELENVIEALILHTRRGSLTWTAWEDGKTWRKGREWSATHGICGFWVYKSVASIEFLPSVYKGERFELGRGEIVNDLMDLLLEMFPFEKRATAEDAMQAALDCLAEYN